MSFQRDGPCKTAWGQDERREIEMVGHIMRREEDYIGKRMLRMELPGCRKRGRTKRRYMDVVKEDMRMAGVTEGAVGDREKWKKRICGYTKKCGCS